VNVNSIGRAVVTGGAGFVGSHICERLLNEGWDVLCVDNFLTSSPRNIEHLQPSPRFQLIRMDVTNYIDVPGDIDVIYHFASPASPADYLQLPIETMRVGSLGTIHTLEMAKDRGARYVLASTSEVYGDPEVHPQPESYWGHVNSVGPRSVYDESKRFAEALTMAYRRYHGVNTGIVRIFNTAGPRLRMNDGRAIPTFIDKALRNEPITVAGDGSQTRSIQYVADLVEGVLLMAASDHSGPVNIGTPHEVSMLELAETIRRLAGSSSEIIFIERPIDDPTMRRPDITLARELLGWKPMTPFEDGLKRTIRWFREQQKMPYEGLCRPGW
jgi:dTDP-glucose 4,6-dehydratase